MPDLPDELEKALDVLATDLKARELRSVGVAAQAVEKLALLVGATVAVRHPHPVLTIRQRPGGLRFMSDTEMEAIEVFEELGYPPPTGAKLAMLGVLFGSSEMHKLQRKRRKGNYTVDELVMLAIICHADEYLELVNGQAVVAEDLGKQQPNVARSFQKLVDLKLLSAETFDPESGTKVWRVEVPSSVLKERDDCVDADVAEEDIYDM